MTVVVFTFSFGLNSQCRKKVLRDLLCKYHSIFYHNVSSIGQNSVRNVLIISYDLFVWSFLDEGAYFSTSGKQVKDATIRWGEPPYSVG